MLRTEDHASVPKRWRLSPASTAWRLFFTCWVVYGLHFATDVVREHYPAVALGDHLTFRLDEYGGLHPDLFETPGYGWHIGNNPGISLFAAVPYALARPLIDPVVDRVQAGRLERGDTVPPAFDSPRARSPGFFAEAYRRGLDVKLGLAALVTHTFFMAPASALGVLLIFFALRWALRDDRHAVWLALLYAFGTPVFFRTGFLNHNLMLGHIAFAGLLAVWNPSEAPRITPERSALLAGLAGGMALLFDYSGVVFLIGLFAYVLVKRFREQGAALAARHGLRYIAGTLPPVLMLWFYQWRAFGNPFLPGQHWMPPVEWIEFGYQGYGLPQLELVLALAFDHRFGFLATAPVLLFGFLALLPRWRRSGMPALELATCVILFFVLWIFFAGSNYVRLQWNTGVRYMTAGLPFLFLPAALVLIRLPRFVLLAFAIGSVVLNWCMAMNREVWRPLGVLDPVVRVFTSGFQLPVLTTLSRMEMFREWIPGAVSAIPLLLLGTVVIYLTWTTRPRVEG